MKTDKTKSSFNLLKGSYDFSSSDPLWFKILIMILMVAFWLGVLYLIKLWAVPVLTVAKLPGWQAVVKLFSGRSP